MKALTTEATEKKRLIVQLVSGLLASGHYTNPDEGCDTPVIKRYDIGEDWKEDGYPRRKPFHVLDDAESILNDIEFIVNQEGGK